jgi:hypothetical protein
VYSLLECPVLWHKFEMDNQPYCYRIIAKYQTWQQSQQNCKLEGGDLVSITNKAELQFITDDLQICGFAWIGLNDRDQLGNWNWVDGSRSDFKNWRPGKTYDEVQQHFQRCTAMDGGEESSGEWHPFVCTNKYYSVRS